jgi:hypothetical protein
MPVKSPAKVLSDAIWSIFSVLYALPHGVYIIFCYDIYSIQEQLMETA